MPLLPLLTDVAHGKWCRLAKKLPVPSMATNKKKPPISIKRKPSCITEKKPSITFMQKPSVIAKKKPSVVITTKKPSITTKNPFMPSYILANKTKSSSASSGDSPARQHAHFTSTVTAQETDEETQYCSYCSASRREQVAVKCEACGIHKW